MIVERDAADVQARRMDTRKVRLDHRQQVRRVEHNSQQQLLGSLHYVDPSDARWSLS